MVPSIAGISPIKRLRRTRSSSRLGQLDILLGILPLKVLLDNSKNCNLRKRPISRGISSWKLLFWRVRILKKLKFPTCGDTEPTSFEDCRSNMVTLWCRRPQVTPRHWQKWKLSFQELITWRGSLMILALNSSNANRSVSLFPPTTEVAKKPHPQKKIKARIQKDGGAELNWESPMQGQAWYDWLGIRLLVCGNKTKGLISLLSAQGKHTYI